MLIAFFKPFTFTNGNRIQIEFYNIQTKDKERKKQKQTKKPKRKKQRKQGNKKCQLLGSNQWLCQNSAIHHYNLAQELMSDEP